MRYAYNHLESKIEKSVYLKSEKFLLDREINWELEVTPKLMNKIFKAILFDHPEMFWFEGKWQMDSRLDRLILSPVYTIPYNERKK